MSQPPDDLRAEDALPVAGIRNRRRWTVYAVWLVPLIAAAVAGYLLEQRMRQYGPTITITFDDATGLKPGQSEIRYHGVTVAEVSALRRSEVPGTGKPQTEFAGLENPAPALGRNGLHVTLATAQLGSIRPNTAVRYRGIEVGMVSSTSLSRDSTAAHVHVLIEPRYARLVRLESRFWNAGGVDVNLSLFKGVEVSMDSLRSLVAGGIVFATPESESPPAKDGNVFVLHDKPQKEWLAWAPKIPLPAGE
jgi:paraquat-inducible protein B